MSTFPAPSLRISSPPRRSPWSWLKLGLVAWLSFTACSPPPANFPYDKEPNPQTQEYVIGESDRLSIHVWNNDDLRTPIQVRPDGTITMPLIGDVSAAGSTPTALSRAITHKLSTFVKTIAEDAPVTVAVTEANSYRITVTGQISSPGVIQSTHYLQIREALALAGGPTRFASPEQTVLIRIRKDGTVVRIPIRYDWLLEGRHLEQDLVLTRGDQLFVP